jgi:hypothetical protein
MARIRSCYDDGAPPRRRSTTALYDDGALRRRRSTTTALYDGGAL